MADDADRAELNEVQAQAERARARAVAALAAADEADAAVAAAESASTPPTMPAERARWFLPLVTALLVVAALSTGGAILLGIQHREAVQSRDRDRAMIDATRMGVLDLISLNQSTAAEGTQKILDRATGDWYDQIETNKDALTSLVEQIRLVTSSNVDDVGIERRNEDGTTTLLVAASSLVTNAAGAQDQIRPWRLRVEVDEVDGQWKMSKVEFVV